MSDARPVRFATAGKAEEECWVGTVRDVEHLVRVCRELRAHIEDGILAQFNAGEQTRRARFDGARLKFVHDDDHEADWERSESSLRAEMLESARLHMTLESGRWETKLSGDPDDVIKEIDDPADVKSIVLSVGTAPNWRLEDRNSFFIRINKYGAEAKMTGHESNWIALASAKLGDEFKRTKPWYAWIRTIWGVIVVIGIPISIMNLALNFYLTSLKLSAISAALLSLVATALVWPGAFWLAQFLTPRFRLFPSTHVIKSGRAIGLSVAVWVLSVVVIPVLIGMLPH